MVSSIIPSLMSAETAAQAAQYLQTADWTVDASSLRDLQQLYGAISAVDQNRAAEFDRQLCFLEAHSDAARIAGAKTELARLVRGLNDRWGKIQKGFGQNISLFATSAKALQQARANLRKPVPEQSTPNVTPRERSVLQMLARGKHLTVAQLAELLNSSQQFARRLLKGMESKGLVEITGHKKISKRRFAAVFGITELGKEHLLNRPNLGKVNRPSEQTDGFHLSAVDVKIILAVKEKGSVYPSQIGQSSVPQSFRRLEQLGILVSERVLEPKGSRAFSVTKYRLTKRGEKVFEYDLDEIPRRSNQATTRVEILQLLMEHGQLYGLQITRISSVAKHQPTVTEALHAMEAEGLVTSKGKSPRYFSITERGRRWVEVATGNL